METYPVSFDVKMRVDAELWNDAKLQDFENQIKDVLGSITMLITDGIEEDLDELADKLYIELVSMEKIG
ncbi:MAG TPA: hypothetical protein VMX17_11635 [Candidatus Glassbacteria bacterium]|nr:hypothetical protein [Candidatus Glassbacteria bacterium]